MATVARRKTSRLSKPSLALIPGDTPPVYVPAWAMATLAGFCEWALSDEAPQRARMTFFEQEVTVPTRPAAVVAQAWRGQFHRRASGEGAGHAHHTT